MKIILLGTPGAGKGTQAEKLSENWSIPRITTGDLFREAVRNKTALGKKVQDILERGSLVPDEIVLELMGERMSKADARKGFVLDGFPRTLGQARGLEKWFSEKKETLHAVIALDISREGALQRMTGRRQCERCGSAVHLDFQPPKKAGVCDKCGGALQQRKDDEESVVRHRLEVYEEQTAPLISFYGEKGVLKRVDGGKGVEEVFREICSLIDEK